MILNGDEEMVIKNRNLSLDKYFNKIKPYLRNIMTDIQNFDAPQIQLTIAIDSFSSKDAEEYSLMHSKSKNIKFRSYNDINEIVDNSLIHFFQDVK